MNGGRISGNTSGNNYNAGNGGGVYNVGTFTMNGGEISGNTAGSNGGGVYNMGSSSISGTFTMSGGKISGNTAVVGGGVVNTRTITMNGGEISGNTASTYGSGVFNSNSSTLIMNGDAIISTDNEVFLIYNLTSPSFPITISGILTGAGTTKIDLQGTPANWNGKAVLQKGSGYIGGLPIERFVLGNFVATSSPYTKTPITGYHLDADGYLRVN
jgi:hypothetical protein